MPELPPRARRIRCPAVVRALWVGTTSACAENTPLNPPWPNGIWNYLRVRGEYRAEERLGLMVPELPPRARRIQIPS